MSSFELELIKKLEEKQNILSQKIDIIDVNLQKLIHELQNIDGSRVESIRLDNSINDYEQDDSEQDDSEQDESTDTSSSFITIRMNPTIYPKMDIATNIQNYIETEIEDGSINLYYCLFSIDTSSLFPYVVYSVESTYNKINLNELMVNIDTSTDETSIKSANSSANSSANNYINFPSITININEEPNIEKYFISEGTFIGYIPDKENPSSIYLFYRFKSPEFLPGKRATINELCNLKSLDEVNIGQSINTLFSQNKELIYAYDSETHEPIDVPFSGYLCDVTDDDATAIINTNNAIDTPLFETDIFNIGLEGEYYYLTEKPLHPETPTTRYAIFPMNAANYESSITDYSDYNSVFYSLNDVSFWAIQSIKQISKI